MFAALLIVFILGYAAIAFEHAIKINKAAAALITGVICWIIYVVASDNSTEVAGQLTEHLGALSGILFFLLGAMTIVELIDVHDGFDLITSRITQTNKRKLIWILSFITFFLSAILDNLTTAIVMVTLIRKLIADKEERLWFAGMIIIAANAGGAWSPIGDVTTTMLWIGAQISAGAIIINLILPSLVCLLVPLLLASVKLKGAVTRPPEAAISLRSPKQQAIVFFSGIAVLILVPVFKTITHLPPYMGILLGLGILWVITELMHKHDNSTEKKLSVSTALRRIDSPSILFFLGILLSIAALQSSGLLGSFSEWLSGRIRSENTIAVSFGLLSAIIDNVPLVAATQGMYSLDQFPIDHNFWHFIAFTTGTGGSALIIGSAAGIAAMGIEKINFFWYLKRISILALAGYFAGVLVYFLQKGIFA